MSKRAYTVRLHEDQAEDLDAVAQVDGLSVAEEIREAITERVAQRRADKAFQSRLREGIEQNRRALERLAE
jgi:predicted DNA-binding protein